MDSLCSIFLWFLDSTAAASVVVLLVIALKKLFRRYISAHMLHVLWLIVLVRLLVPVFPDSPVSVFHLLQLGSELKQAVAWMNPFTDNQYLQSLAKVGQDQIPQQSSINQMLLENQRIPTGLSLQETQDGVSIFTQTYPVALQIASVVWLAGVVSFIWYYTAYLIKIRQQRVTFRLATDPRIRAVMADCLKKFGIEKPIPVYTGNRLESPYISGLFHPWVYLPEKMSKELGTSSLTHIFSHELAHLKRKDIAWNAVGSFVLAVHWMNPLVWIAVRQMKADRELACDACALEVLGEAETIPYGLTIVECLKRFASERNQPNLVSFNGASNQNEMMRRICMIKSFKKGSYKLSAVAVLCVGILGAVTLTNAGEPILAGSAGSVKAADDRVLFESPNRAYGNLEKTAEISDFAFMVPAALPDGYRFQQGELISTADGKRGKARLYFEKRKENAYYGSFAISASAEGAGVEAAYAAIEIAERTQGEESRIKKETVNVKGKEALKVTVQAKNRDKLYYIWQDQGIQYQIDGYALTDQELVTLIASMKYPDQDMYRRYVNHDLLIEDIYDTGDVRKVPESVGFAPKFPLQLPGSLQAKHAYETQKINFSYPDDEADKKTRVLCIAYRGTDGNKPGVTFQQIKNNNLYENIKKTGHIAYYQIDGEKNVVEAKPLDIGGKEVVKTAKYKIDGSLSGPNEADLVSYLWKENDVCYQVTFTAQEDESEQKEIVKYLMNEPLAELTKLP
ncbi:M56 family metallopeptidase [Brevibacillus sp. B_LB10_24]|uniref:M56 family metallopeptidase n=1 Tax=Brevibacillus sp. B_LB10_24 TaxID=3380645 RepID=UPI0038B7A434